VPDKAIHPTCSNCSRELEQLTTFSVNATVGFAAKTTGYTIAFCRECNRLVVIDDSTGKKVWNFVANETA